MFPLYRTRSCSWIEVDLPLIPKNSCSQRYGRKRGVPILVKEKILSESGLMERSRKIEDEFCKDLIEEELMRSPPNEKLLTGSL